MITVVINLAEILDVSIDFLTNSTLDNTYKLVSDELGLSQKSIEIIKTLNDNNLSDAINCLIEDNNFVDFLQYFYQYKTEFADRKTAEKYFNKFISKIGPYARAIYPVDNLVDYDDQGTGNDWLVIRLNPNPITGLYPGSERGFYPIDWAAENSNQEVRLAGFGKDDQSERSYSLQVSYGKLLQSENDLILRHDADSTAGNSGTAIIDNKTEKIIGIHTNGGCQKSSNAGTWINKVSRLQKAIQECQDLDQKD